jgi:lipoprotein-anchoring transpeptidase ErfK/SrfK
MAIRTTSAAALILIALGGAGNPALAQYYLSAQAYPPQAYSSRQPLGSVADGDNDAPPINAPVVQGSPLPPIGSGPQWNEPPSGTRYGRGTRPYPAPVAAPDAAGQHYMTGTVAPGPAGSAKQDAILQDTMRSRLPISHGQTGPGPDDSGVGGSTRYDRPTTAASSPYLRPDTRSLQPPQSYEPIARGPYNVPGTIPPGPAGSAEQDAILQDAMRSRQPIGPGQMEPAPTDPRVTGSIGSGDDPRNMAAFPPDVRPETGPKKELPPQFRRTLVDYYTKEPAGTIIIDTPNTYLYLVLGNGKALRYGIGVGREGFTWSGVQRVTRMAEWPDWNPPEEMIVRQPYLPRFMAGGETNPLGARALYLGQTVYRIHGTNQPSTIGTFVSSGCIRLTNEDIMHLYSRVRVGTRVVVLPGRPPATAAASSLAMPAAMPPSDGSFRAAPLGPAPSAMAR